VLPLVLGGVVLLGLALIAALVGAYFVFLR
jgi:hypothetical protein